MLEIGFVEDEGWVFDLRQFEHQFIVLIEEFDRIVSPAGFGQRHVDIPVFSREHISGNLVYLYGHKRFDQEGVAVDKNERILCPVEDGIAEGWICLPVNAADDAVSSADRDDGGDRLSLEISGRAVGAG